MSKRIRSAEESARRDSQATKLTLLTAVADGTAPREPNARGDHYRRHLVDAHRTIETLQLKIKDIEADRDRIKSHSGYSLSLCVTRTAAEEGRLAAFRLGKGQAAILAEPHGIPNDLSEAIYNLPDPKPKWTN